VPTKQLNIGKNKGRPRLWIEGKFLLEANWQTGERWDPEPAPNRLTLRKSAEGKRKVAGTPQRPIIDMAGRIIEAAFDCAKVSRVELTATSDTITIRPAGDAS